MFICIKLWNISTISRCRSIIERAVSMAAQLFVLEFETVSSVSFPVFGLLLQRYEVLF